MAWTEITEALVLTKLSGPELSSLKTAALADGQANPLTEIIADVVTEVRGYVAGNPKNTLGSGSTIPDELMIATLAIIRLELLTRLPGLKGLITPERVAAADAGREKCRDAARGLMAIEQPATASEQVIAGPSIELIESRARTATRAKMEGL
ncbi:MAG TPA: hypothetical protein PLU30_23595 [Verrucomicrobiae bacterium]|nr:hypothetical protein [Verrucomicrobiae bacterium]